MMHSLEQAPTHDSDVASIVEKLRNEPGRLGTFLRSIARERGANVRILVFVDQLEELFTLGTDVRDRNAFLACLEGVANDASSPLRVIAAMRSDFLDPSADDQRLSSFVSRGLYLLPQLQRDALAEALIKPLELTGYRFEDESLVDEMVNEIDESPSALPLLQFAATKVWEARDTEKRILSRAAYTAQGGIVGALSTHVDDMFLSLPSSQQLLARAILVHLVTPEGTRAIVSRDELVGIANDSEVERILNKLVAARLVAIDKASDRPEGQGKTVELTHESLIDRWSRLAHWVGEHEQDARFLAQLRNAAANWERSGASEGLLWRDAAAKTAETCFARYKPLNLHQFSKPIS